MAVIPNQTSGPYVTTGRGASSQYTGNPYITPTNPWFFQNPPQYAGGNPNFNEAGGGQTSTTTVNYNDPSMRWQGNPQVYQDFRNAVTGLTGFNPNGMGNWNPWANYGSSAMGGFQGGLGRPGLGYGTDPNMPTQWQGMPNTPFYSDNRRNMDHISTFAGVNPWAGQTTNYIRRPSGGRVPR